VIVFDKTGGLRRLRCPKCGSTLRAGDRAREGGEGELGCPWCGRTMAPDPVRWDRDDRRDGDK
jgi:hypothetical protein